MGGPLSGSGFTLTHFYGPNATSARLQSTSCIPSTTATWPSLYEACPNGLQVLGTYSRSDLASSTNDKLQLYVR